MTGKGALKILLIMGGFLIIGYCLYVLSIVIIASGLYSSNSKEVIFEQKITQGKFSLVLDTGDPLSVDSWEYYIDDDLIKKQYANYLSHVDTIVLNDESVILMKITEQNDSTCFELIPLQ
jgi:hypothetical protein